MQAIAVITVCACIHFRHEFPDLLRRVASMASPAPPAVPPPSSLVRAHAGRIIQRVMDSPTVPPAAAQLLLAHAAKLTIKSTNLLVAEQLEDWKHTLSASVFPFVVPMVAAPAPMTLWPFVVAPTPMSRKRKAEEMTDLVPRTPPTPSSSN